MSIQIIGGGRSRSMISMTPDDLAREFKNQSDNNYLASLINNVFPEELSAKIINSSMLDYDKVNAIFSSSYVTSTKASNIILDFLEDDSLNNFDNLIAVINGSSVNSSDVASALDNYLGSTDPNKWYRTSIIFNSDKVSITKISAITNLMGANDVYNLFSTDYVNVGRIYDILHESLSNSNISDTNTYKIIEVPRLDVDNIASICNMPDIIVSRVFSMFINTAIDAQSDRVAKIINSSMITPQRIIEIFSSATASWTVVENIIESEIKDTSLNNYGNLAAVMQGTSVTSDMVATAFTNSIDVAGPDRIATIVSASTLTASKLASILASSDISTSNVRKIIGSTAFTRAVAYELFESDPVSSGRATFTATDTDFSYTYDSTNLRGDITFALGGSTTTGNYGELEFSSTSVSPGYAVLLRYYKGGIIVGYPPWWSFKVLVGSSEIMSFDIGNQSDGDHAATSNVSVSSTGTVKCRLEAVYNVNYYSETAGMYVVAILK